MRSRSGVVYLGVAALVGVVVFLLIQHVTRKRIIARAVTPDGVELCLVQRWNGFEDPFFNTTFAARKPGSNWQTYYFHHEDSYWGHAAIAIDTNARVARIHRGDALVIMFAWPKEIYTFYRRGAEVRDGQKMPTGWTPVPE